MCLDKRKKKCRTATQVNIGKLPNGQSTKYKGKENCML